MNKTKDYNFDEAVCELVRLIPVGRVTTYGHIAKALGVARSSRLVGMVLSKSHRFPMATPAHRVVNRQGLLTGKHHFETPTMMEERLRDEGVLVVDDKIQDFEKLLWDPLKELDL